jgi:hypothetical protein
LVQKLSSASDSLSYSGRLVNADGSPVTGPVDLKAELIYSNDPTVILCHQDLTNIALTNGVFHIKLDFDCASKTITQILAETPPTHSAAIRIIDVENGKAYSFQALHSMPYSHVSKQLVKMGATDGQVLTWDGEAWKPLAPAALESGSVGTNELADGSVTDPKVASGISRSKLASGNAGYVLVNDGAGLVGETPYLSIAQGGTGATTVAGVFANLGLGSAATADLGLTTGNALAFDDVKFCLETEKLMLTAAPTVQWICAPENSPEDSTKLPLAGGMMAGTIDMNTNRIIGLPTPTDPGEAVSKDYVDTLNESKWKTSGSHIHFDGGNVGIDTATPAEKLDVAGNIALTGKVRLKSDTANYVELKAPLSLGSTLTFNLPNAYGTDGYALVTDGAGNLSWGELANTSTAVGGDLTGTISNAQIASGVVGSTEITDLSVTNADLANTSIAYGKLNLIDGDIPQAKVNGLETALGSKEPSILAGTTAQYWRGDKSWQTLDTTAVAEGANLYFTEPRVLGTDLAGLSTLAGTVSSTDTVLTAIGKLSGNQSNYVLKAGDTMSGILNMGTNKITGVVDPTLASDAATKNYVDGRIDATASKWTLSGSDIYYDSGNVGIGTTSPAHKLHVETILSDAANYAINSSATTSATVSGSYATIGHHNWIRPFAASGVTNSSTTYGDAIRVLRNTTMAGDDGTVSHIVGSHISVGHDNDNVASPVTNTVEGISIQPLFGSGTISNYYGLALRSPSPTGATVTNNYGIYQTDTNAINYLNGKVGVGTTSPSNKFEVSGGHAFFRSKAYVYSDSGWGSTTPTVSLAVGDNDTGLNWVSDGVLQLFANNQPVIHMTNTAVGIGTTTPAYKLDVNGHLRITGTPYRDGGDIAWTVPSDARLKDVLGKYEYGLEEISRLSTIRFKYKENNPVGATEDTEYIGVLAQDVQKVIPEAVTENKNGFLNLNSSPIFWALINANKELKERNERTEEKVEKMARDIASVKAENDSLRQENDAIKSYLCSKDLRASFCNQK